MTTPTTAPTSAPLTPAASTVRGRFLWYDLVASDVDAATRFYTAVTGWTLTSSPADGARPPYTMWMNGHAPVGGVSALSAEAAAGGAPAHWMAHIGTPDAEATYREALALGARSIMAPTGVPDIGCFAILADPHGATFAIFQPLNPGAPPAAMPAVGEFSWHELATTDHAAALAFYATLFGWAPTEAMDMGSDGVYQMFGQGEATYGGIFNRRHADGPPHWLVYVRVPDLDRALDAVRRGGGQVLNGPMAVPGASLGAVVHDRQAAHDLREQQEHADRHEHVPAAGVHAEHEETERPRGEQDGADDAGDSDRLATQGLTHGDLRRTS